MSDTITYIVGLSVRTDPTEPAVPGSTRGHKCSECGGECWLSPEGARIWATSSAQLICDRCTRKFADEDPAILPPTDAQMEVINAHLKKLGRPPVSKEAMLEEARNRLLGKNNLN